MGSRLHIRSSNWTRVDFRYDGLLTGAFSPNGTVRQYVASPFQATAAVLEICDDVVCAPAWGHVGRSQFQRGFVVIPVMPRQNGDEILYSIP